MRVLIVSTFKSWVQRQLLGCWLPGALPEPKGTVLPTHCTCPKGNQKPHQVQGQGPFAINKHSSCSLPLDHAPELGQAAAPHQGRPKRTPAFIYNTPQVTYHRKERVQYNSRTQQRKGTGSLESLQHSHSHWYWAGLAAPSPPAQSTGGQGAATPSHGAAQQLRWAKLTQSLSLAQARMQEPSKQCQERVA